MSHVMRPIKDTVPLDEAVRIIDERTAPIERTERIALDDANGRVVSSDIVARADVPPFSRAAMDGYAVIAADTFGAGQYDPKILACVEKVFTGQVPHNAVTTGTCIEIATGAPMPEGADAVVMVEETERADGGRVRVFSPVYPRQNVGRQGADIQAGQTILRRGDLLNPSRIGAVAAVGLNDIDVFAKPRVAVMSTGNEIVEPGQPLAPGQIYDINRFTLTTILTEHGAVPVPHAVTADTLDDLSLAMDDCLEADIVIFSGGSSVGERDLILDVIDRKGEVLIHGIAVKPGKPTLFGVIDGTPVFGMPGYPTSCLSNAYMLLVPVVRKMARLPMATLRSIRLPLGQRIVSTTGRHQFYTVRIADGIAMPAFKASGDITSMSQADGYIEISAQTEIVDKGELVDVKLF